MTTTLTATANSDTFSAFHFTQTYSINYDIIAQHWFAVQDNTSFFDLLEPYNLIDEQHSLSSQTEAVYKQWLDQAVQRADSFASAIDPHTHWPGGKLYFELFDETLVDYSKSNAGVFIDLEQNIARGGFAQGDILTAISDITGSPFNDVIRASGFAEFIVPSPSGSDGVYFTLGHAHVLNGGAGDDVLEGRFSSDVLDGGAGFDFASYESSGGVDVQLAGVNGDPQKAHANFSDAAGDTLISIEGLIGSKGDDILTGNAEANALAGGLGNDILNGRDGSDTAIYSRATDFFSFGQPITLFFDSGDTIDRVVVHLGLNGSNGTAAEFKADIHNFPTITYNHVSTDTLISIENVVGTAGPDEIFGNEQDNVLSGEGGNDFFDAGRGDDIVNGGAGVDTVSFASYDGLAAGRGTIDLRAEVGQAIYFSFGQQVGEGDILSSIENVIGSNLNETIFGGPGPNTLDGGLGNDTIIGGTSSGPSGDTVSYASHDTVPLLPGEGDTISLGINGADGHYTRSALVTNRFGFHFSSIVETDI